MTSPQLPTDSLKDLAEQKEKEWRDIQHLRVQTLEGGLQETKTALKAERTKFDKLKEDFKYNLRLLSERDAELARYDSLFADLRTKTSANDAELSELKIRVADLQMALVQEAKSRDELQSHYEMRVRQKQVELEQYRSGMDSERESERQQLETLKRGLERQLRETEAEMDIQRKDLNAGFDEALRKREHEFRVHADEMNSTVLAHELKAKLLGKEVESLKAAQAATSADWEEADGSIREREREIKQLQWTFSDTLAIKDAQIDEFESKQLQTEQKMKRLAEDFKRKHVELDLASRAKDDQLVKLRESAKDKQRHLEGTCETLRTELSETEVTRRQLEWTITDLNKEKEVTVERLTAEVAEVNAKWDGHLAAMSHDSVSRDLELQTLRGTEGKLIAEVRQLKENVVRYKKDLQTALAREESLQQSKAQVEVDWQRRCEDIERQQYEKSEDFVRLLTRARDKAIADLREREREWEGKEERMGVVMEERDRAEATLREHGLSPDNNIDLTQSSSSQVMELRQQNDRLRDVVHQMRHQMEALGSQVPPDQATLTRSPERKAVVASDDYVKDVENELIQLKAKYNALEMVRQNDLDLGGGHDSVAKDNAKVANDNPMVLRHIEELNATIGQLRGEKVGLMAQVRKQQARIQHLKQTVTDLGKQPREKQALVEQLQYRLSAETGRQGALVASVRHRVSELEVELSEARKEADEYHRVNIEGNLQLTTLSNEVSALKMELASERPAVSFGAQELLIQQLQDEISRLVKCQQQMLSDDSLTDAGRSSRGQQGCTTNAAMAEMHRKLRQAAKHISLLTRQKQQLIEMGNRLRAELNKFGLRAPQSTHQPQPPSHDTDYSKPAPTQSEPVETGSQPITAKSNHLSQMIQTKLTQLEKLQYELTKQDLAFAQKGEGHPLKVKPGSLTLSTSGECSTTDEDAGRGSRVETRGTQSSVATDQPSREPRTDNPQPHLRTSLSSLGGESLQEIWGMLEDDGPSPKPYTPTGAGDGPHQTLAVAGRSDQWAVTGRRVKPQHDVAGPVKTSNVVKLGPGRRNARKAKVRNYNIKDV